jgi:ribosome-associated protein
MSKNGSHLIARSIAEYSLTKKAKDVLLLDLRPLCSMTDFFVICHGDSKIQVKAIADAIVDGMKDHGIRVWHREGYEYLHWVLLDYVDVVVHIFHKNEREFYALERLWGDAAKETVLE